MTSPLDAELGAVLARLRREHDLLPFFEQLLPSSETRLAPLPDAMMAQLRTSVDFSSLRPGIPVWITLSAPPDATAELVLYRAEAGGRHYVIAPAQD